MCKPLYGTCLRTSRVDTFPTAFSRSAEVGVLVAFPDLMATKPETAVESFLSYVKRAEVLATRELAEDPDDKFVKGQIDAYQHVLRWAARLKITE